MGIKIKVGERLNHTTFRGYTVIYKRILKSGNVYETWEYEKPIVRGFKGKSTGRANEKNTTEEQKEQNRKKTELRGKARIRRLVNANISAYKGFKPKFNFNTSHVTVHQG